MPKQVPFTAHVRVVPNRANGKRFEYVRDLQKIATQVYSELEADAELALAAPGGGQHQSYHGSGGWSGATNAMAVKPQIGQFPAQLMITGYIETDTPNTPPVPNKTIIHTGTADTGYGGSAPWSVNPVTATDTLAKSLKTKLDVAVNAVLGSSDWDVYKIDVAGVMYGHGGYHFPR